MNDTTYLDEPAAPDFVTVRLDRPTGLGSGRWDWAEAATAQWIGAAEEAGFVVERTGIDMLPDKATDAAVVQLGDGSRWLLRVDPDDTVHATRWTTVPGWVEHWSNRELAAYALRHLWADECTGELFRRLPRLGGMYEAMCAAEVPQPEDVDPLGDLEYGTPEEWAAYKRVRSLLKAELSALAGLG